MTNKSYYLYLILAALLAGVSYTKAQEVTEAPAQVIAEEEIPAEVPDSLEFGDFSTDLEELTVVEHKKLVQSDGAKLTYNVSEDPQAGSANILDILRKVPGVQVDAEDNVKVNGQSNFKILMNGKEDPMLKGDLKTILKSLPANSILKIEVISEPGAKYEAEGIGGVLNIVTDRSKTLSGFMAQLGAWVGVWNVGGYAKATTKIKNVMLDARFNYNNGKAWPRTNRSERIIENLTPGSETTQYANAKAKSGWDYLGPSLNLSWEPDTLNLFTLSANYGNNTWYNKGNEWRGSYDSDNRQLWDLDRSYYSPGCYNGFYVSASYQHNFKREDHNLVVSYEYDYAYQNYHTEYILTSSQGLTGDWPYSKTDSKGGNLGHILQVDYTNRLSPKHLLEAGIKGNLNHNGQKSETFYGVEPETSAEVDNMTVKMTQIKDIYGVYGSYSGTFGKWSVKGGLRYELTRMGIKYKIGEYPDFMVHLNDIVPNGAISYNLSGASTLRLAYQMRISRPGIYQVNPYINNMTPGQISYGNPDLESQRGHTVSLAYSNYDHPFSGSVKMSYRYVDNAITDVIYMQEGLINYTYANIGKNHDAWMDLNFDWSIIKDLRLSFYGTLEYVYFSADSGLIKGKNDGWITRLGGSLNYTLPCRVRLSGYGGFDTPWIDLQGKGKNNGYYYGVSASRSWLKDDALTLQVSASNLFPTSRTYAYEQSNEDVMTRYKGWSKQWNLSFSISYKFGGLKAEVKQTAANIEKESSAGGNSKQ